MKSLAFLLILFGSIWLSVIETKHHKLHGRKKIHYHEKELHRTKRHLELGLEKIFSRIHVSPIKHARNKRSSFRPYVAGQVQDVQIQIKIKTTWKEDFWNKYSPRYRLLVGNIIDEVSNALIDNRNFVAVRVLKFRPSKWSILVDLSLKFFKTEVDPLHYLEGIVASGWISGLQVFNNYFKVIKIVNGNENFPAWNYPKGLRLRLHPAVLTKVNTITENKHNVVLPANYKEIKISFQMFQKWNQFFLAKYSAPYRLLSGNIEQSLAHAFFGSPKYLDAETLGFRESLHGQVVVDMLVRFTVDEVYPAQKLKILVSSGRIGGTSVISDSLEIYEINNITSDKPSQELTPNYEFSKPHSDADVNQGLNETEMESSKSSKKRPLQNGVKEVSTPIFPSIEVIKKQGKVSVNNFQQNAVMKNQPTNLGSYSKENVLQETKEAIFPKQSKISENANIPVVGLEQPLKQPAQPLPISIIQPIQQQQQLAKSSPQATQYDSQQQQQLSQLVSQPSKQVYKQVYNQLPIQLQLSKPEPQKQPVETSQESVELNKNLWQSLPQQVEGKLVLNQEQPILLSMRKENKLKGNEKQLAQPLSSVNQKSNSDLELEKLQHDITAQNSNKTVATGVETQNSSENLPYSSDTPTLTKTLYPQNSGIQQNGIGIQNVQAKKQQEQSLLQAAENFLTERQDNDKDNSTKAADAEAESKERAEDHDKVITMVAGVVSEQIKHFKAIQMQFSHSINNSANGSLAPSNVVAETNYEEKNKPEQGDSSAIVQLQRESTNLGERVANNTSANISKEVWPQEGTVTPHSNTSTGVNTNVGGNTQIQENATLYTSSSEAVKPSASIGAANWKVNASKTQLSDTSATALSQAKYPAFQKVSVTNLPPAMSGSWYPSYQTANNNSASSVQEVTSSNNTNATNATTNLLLQPQTSLQPNSQASPQPNSQANLQPNSQANIQPNSQASLQPNSQASFQPNTQESSLPTTVSSNNKQVSSQPSNSDSASNTYPSQSTQINTVPASANSYPATSQQASINKYNTYLSYSNNYNGVQWQQEPAKAATYQPVSPQVKNESTFVTNATSVNSTTSLTKPQESLKYPNVSQEETHVSSTERGSNLISTYPYTSPKPNEPAPIKQVSQTSDKTETAWKSPSTKQNQEYATNSGKQGLPYTYETVQTIPLSKQISQSESLSNGEPVKQDTNKDDQKQRLYTPKIISDNWPPVANTNTPPQSVTTPVTNVETTNFASYTQHSLHGKMILQRPWHPLLENKQSVPYMVLSKHVQHSIEEVYSSHHLHVICNVVELSKELHYSSQSTTEKVGVKFNLVYSNNDVEIVKTMTQAAKNGVISELLVYPDSVEVNNGTTPVTSTPESQQSAEQTTSHYEEQPVVATSPMPTEATIEVKPDAMAPTNYSNSVLSTTAPVQTTKPDEPTFEFVTAPKDTPKSCQEIRDFGIGKDDGQYVLEARKGCHLSVICQNMQDPHPKEFLGGPNQGQWKAYPFAALIKISTHDKENIENGACLENTDEGRKLLEQIYIAKGKQPLPTVPWKTNIKKMLEGRKKRELKRNRIFVIESNEKIRPEVEFNRFPRSSEREDADWGVL